MLTVISRRSTSTEGTGLANTVTGKKPISNHKKKLLRSKHTTEKQNDCVKLQLHLMGWLEAEYLATWKESSLETVLRPCRNEYTYKREGQRERPILDKRKSRQELCPDSLFFVSKWPAFCRSDVLLDTCHMSFIAQTNRRDFRNENDYIIFRMVARPFLKTICHFFWRKKHVLLCTGQNF